MNDKVMKEVQLHHKAVEERGYEPLFTALYGSQNYGVDTPESDVDTKTLICPSFQDLVNSTRVTNNIECGTGFASIVDFRDMFKMYYKGSINFVETLFTPYVVVNDPEWLNAYLWLRSNRERIARMNPFGTIHAAAGHAHNISKFSNTKSVANIMRLKDFIVRYDRGEESYEDILVPSNLDEIREVKMGEWKDEYVGLVTRDIEEITNIVERYKKSGAETDEEMAAMLKEMSYKLMKRVMKKYA